MDRTDDLRAKLGIWLVMGSTVAIVVLSVVILLASWLTAQQDPQSVTKAAQLLLSSLLPMFGTWIGTVLAFYFSRENFEAANKGTLDLVRVVSQRLRTTSVKSAMMPLARIISVKVPASGTVGDIKTSDVEAMFSTPGANSLPISRLFIVDSAGVCVGILHRSIYMEAKARGLASNPPLDLTKGLAVLLDRPCVFDPAMTYLQYVQNVVAVVSQDQNLVDAKAAMEAIPGCQDVIVTATGKRTEGLLGWISNVDISRLSQA
jgi:hypothetical protein